MCGCPIYRASTISMDNNTEKLFSYIVNTEQQLFSPGHLLPFFSYAGKIGYFDLFNLLLTYRQTGGNTKMLASKKAWEQSGNKVKIGAKPIFGVRPVIKRSKKNVYNTTHFIIDYDTISFIMAEDLEEELQFRPEIDLKKKLQQTFSIGVNEKIINSTICNIEEEPVGTIPYIDTEDGEAENPNVVTIHLPQSSGNKESHYILLALTNFIMEHYDMESDELKSDAIRAAILYMLEERYGIQNQITDDIFLNMKMDEMEQNTFLTNVICLFQECMMFLEGEKLNFLQSIFLKQLFSGDADFKNESLFTELAVFCNSGIEESTTFNYFLEIPIRANKSFSELKNRVQNGNFYSFPPAPINAEIPYSLSFL